MIKKRGLMKNVALKTGASSGIGKKFAHIHAEAGGDLIIVARSIDKLEELKIDLETKNKVKVITIKKDLTKENAVKELFEEVQKHGVEVDYLINNAGFGGHGKFYERNWSEDYSMIQLNIVALTELCRLFLPLFIKRNSGRILNVSSTASLMPGPLQAVYFATKAYVTSFSNALTEELSGTNVTVTALMPGATETDFAKTAGMENSELFSNTFSARGVAKDGYKAMLKGEMEVISGVTTSQKLMMNAIPFAPKKILMKQIRKMQTLK
jgi:short-subunit dehydrogenase